MTVTTSHLPAELRELVSDAVKIWGACLRQHMGEKFFSQIETLRAGMRAISSKPQKEQTQILLSNLNKLEKHSEADLLNMAHAFSIMLELMNTCESAYRTFRIQKKENLKIQSSPYAIIYVLTAHPTEARSKEILDLFRNIEETLIKCLEDGLELHSSELHELLTLALFIPMAKSEKPTVENEADTIFSYALHPRILSAQIDLLMKGVPVYFRSWVGGDKDGHPGVDEKTLEMALCHSRKLILDFALNLIEDFSKKIVLLHDSLSGFMHQVGNLKKSLLGLYLIKDSDGREIVKARELLKKISQQYRVLLKSDGYYLQRLEKLFWIYPALVLPLEVREDSGVVSQALNGSGLAIERMLLKIKAISHGHDPRWYVRGFILSMCESSQDLLNGRALVKRVFNATPIPVVPLFENEFSLVNAIVILQEYLKQDPTVKKQHKKDWQGRFEVMLGYSDSSKESGVLPSRVLLAKAMCEIDTFLTQTGMTPVFFHGSGGSIERGGGSIKEQVEWWPASAINIFKVTTQGEMVARNIANPFILKSNVGKIISEFRSRKLKSGKIKIPKCLEEFSQYIMHEYRELVTSDSFWTLIEGATPYRYLDELKIGSRPSRRAQGPSDRKLRAIPWVLCWTQARLLLPTWWGVGTAWSKLSDKDKFLMATKYVKHDLFKSFLKNLGFTLGKVELAVFFLYLEKSNLSAREKLEWRGKITKEYRATLGFLEDVTGEKNPLWFRPWLAESIALRSPMIHPLNLIQIIALKKRNGKLLRASVTGIASGMLTTG